MKKIIFHLYCLLNVTIFGISMIDINGIEKLENYEEIKRIQIENIYSEDEVYRKEGGLYDPKTDSNVNGAVVERYLNGSIYKLMFYKNGFTEEILYGYYENGKLEFKTPYFNDKRNGERIFYYENGMIQEKAGYVNGKLDGESIYYYKNGSLKYKIISRNGIILEIEIYNVFSDINEKYGSIEPYFGLFTEFSYDKNGNQYIAKQSYVNLLENEKNRIQFERTKTYIEYYPTGEKEMICHESFKGRYTCTSYDKKGREKGAAKEKNINVFLGLLGVLFGGQQ